MAFNPPVPPIPMPIGPTKQIKLPNQKSVPHKAPMPMPVPMN